MTRNLYAYVISPSRFARLMERPSNFTGEAIGQQRGDTFEVGVKADFLNRKLSWNLNCYDLARSNVDFNFNLQRPHAPGPRGTV